MNPVAIESHLKLVLLQWMVIMAVAWLMGRLGQRLGQPLAVGEIAGGLLLGPSFLGWISPDALQALFPAETGQSLQLLAKLGLILLMFQVGMEFDFGHLANRSHAVIAVSVTGIVVPALRGALIGPWLHRHFAPETNRFGFQLFVCIALAISALPIMGRILLELGLERTALGATAISAAALDDITGWVLLGVATALVTAQFTWGPLLAQLAGIALFFVILQWLVGPALRRFWRCSFCLLPTDPQGRSPARLLACTLGLRSPRLRTGDCSGRETCGLEPRAPEMNRVPPTFMAVLLVALFGCAVTTHLLGIFSIFGAFLLGVALHREITLVAAWRDRCRDFVLVALVPIFFTYTGLRTEVGSLTTSLAWAGAAVVLAAAVLGKLGGCYLGARQTGQPWREAACVAALMNTRALMGLVAINIGYDLGLLTRELFTMFVLMALVTTVMTGPLLRWWLPPELKTAAPAASDGGR